MNIIVANLLTHKPNHLMYPCHRANIPMSKHIHGVHETHSILNHISTEVTYDTQAKNTSLILHPPVFYCSNPFAYRIKCSISAHSVWSNIPLNIPLPLCTPPYSPFEHYIAHFISALYPRKKNQRNIPIVNLHLHIYILHYIILYYIILHYIVLY